MLLTHLNIASYGWSRNIAIDVPIAQSPAASSRKAPERSNEIHFKIVYIISLPKLSWYVKLFKPMQSNFLNWCLEFSRYIDRSQDILLYTFSASDGINKVINGCNHSTVWSNRHRQSNFSHFHFFYISISFEHKKYVRPCWTYFNWKLRNTLR